MREIKFRAWNTVIGWWASKEPMTLNQLMLNNSTGISEKGLDEDFTFMQFTGLTDKNGSGLIEVYEGDIIDVNGNLRGNTYEIQQRKTDLVIPRMGTREWNLAYKEAVARGFDFT